MWKTKKPVRRLLIELLYWSLYFGGILPFVVLAIIEGLCTRILDGFQALLASLDDLRDSL